MKRFIDHQELARDSRFVRQDNAQATVLAGLPDDVDVTRTAQPAGSVKPIEFGILSSDSALSPRVASVPE